MITAKLTSARPLPPDRIDELKKTIVGTSGKSVDFIEITDASLIGGFVLDIDFERLDAAVSNQLRRMKKQLMAKD
jgi:F0F1-type ATP synthase delta subunit